MAQSSAARERVWRSLGSLEPFALGQSPGSSTLLAGPKWPAVRQNFRVIHRPSGNVMIVSDGLSDPFDDIHEGKQAPGSPARQAGRLPGACHMGGAVVVVCVAPGARCIGVSGFCHA